jgi:hypothetical protein
MTEAFVRAFSVVNIYCYIRHGLLMHNDLAVPRSVLE